MAEKQKIEPGSAMKISRLTDGWKLDVVHRGSTPGLSGVARQATFEEIVAFIRKHYEVN